MKRALLCLLAASSLAGGGPALAQNPLSELLGSLLGAQGQFGPTINDRQIEFDARVQAGVNNRTLTPAEAAQLRAEFAAIASTEARYRANGGGVTPDERMDLNNRLETLSRRAQGTPNNFDNRGGGQAIDQRQMALDARIDAGIRDRTLTPVEAAQLRAEFQAIAREEAGYRNSGRGISPAERSDIDRRLDALSNRIVVNRNDIDNRAGGQAIDQRQMVLDARIDAGLRDRTLTVAEAAQLRAEFQAIAREEATYRNSGRGISPAERADLDRRLDALSNRVAVNRNDNDGRGGGQNFNQRQIALDARIDAGLRDRTLTPNEAAQLRREFQDIARLEANYRANGRMLSPVERADLDRRFDALERRLVVDRRNDDRRWTNLNQRQAQFNNRLNQAVAERRITTRAAANLRIEFANIARLERQYRLSRPGITPPERADLNARFNRMEANFRASVNNNNGLEALFESLFGR